MQQKKGIIMNASYTTLLLTSCITLSLTAMEHETLSSDNKPITLTKFHVEDIRNLYEKTYERMETITQKNPDATKNLLEIIEHTNHLTSQGITIPQIVRISFKQDRVLKDNIEYYCNSFLEVNNGPHNGPHYISALFELLKPYNELLAQKKLISPTEKQCAEYKNNLTINRGVKYAASFGLPIKTASLKEQNVLSTIPDTVAAKEFYTLFNNICTLRYQAPTIMETIASTIYGSIDAKK